MYVVMRLPNSEQRIISIPPGHPEMLGTWLKAWVDSWKIDQPSIPLEFTLRIS